MTRTSLCPIRVWRPLVLALLAVVATAPWASAQLVTREEEDVRRSINVLNEIMAIPAEAIPEQMLAGAEGVAIIPNVIKGGFVLGARHGRGVLVVKDEQGNWHAPLFITITGGSVGWQAGVQSTDVILVFRTRKSIEGMLSRKLTLGADAAIAAGPVGRQAAAATDLHLQAEIFSYARSRGLFVGASFDGSMIEVDGIANASYYRSPAPGQPVVVPATAIQLAQQVASYTTTTVPAPNPAAAPNGAPPAGAPQGSLLAHQYATHESDVLRAQLSKTSPELFKRLDPAWTNFLALPPEVFIAQGHPSIESIDQCQQRYNAVVADPQYRALAALPAFQSTYGLLNHYASTLRAENALPQLPPPPVMR